MSLTPEKKAQIKQLWMDGYSATEIGVIVGKTRNSVIGWVHRQGIKRNLPMDIANRKAAAKRSASTRYQSRWTKERDEWLTDLHGKKLSDREIGERMGIAHSTVAKRRKVLGLKANTPPRKPKRRPRLTDRAKALMEANANTQGLTILDLGPRQCRFCTNNPPVGGVHVFCGNKVERGTSYCADHAAIVFREEEEVA